MSIWTKPWKYKEGTAISIGLLITGALLQFSVGPLDWSLFMCPVNIIVLAVFVALLFITYSFRRRIYLFRFVATAEAAVPALVTASVLTVIMGLTRQMPEGRDAIDPLGLSRMLCFWPFVLIYLWNTVIVAEVAIKQIVHFRKRNIPSLINHIGIFIFVTCGVLGSADMQRLKMYCEKGKPEWRAVDSRGDVHELPFAIELRKFAIDEYPLKLALFDRKSGEPLPKDKPLSVIVNEETKSCSIMGWDITVEQKIDSALPKPMSRMLSGMPATMAKMMKMDELGMRITAEGFEKYDGEGAAAAVLLTARKDREVKKGWVSTGSYMFPMSTLSLDANTELAMMPREPLRYYSDVNVYTKSGSAMQAHIKVNKPYSIGAWKVYQLDFNKEQGKWSTLSVFELICDPWLPATYFGIYMLLIGAVLMFVVAGRKDKREQEENR